MAIVLASVAIPGMMWAVRDAQRNRTEPVMFDRARWLAVERLEDVIADRHSAARGYGYVVNASYPAEPSVSGFPGLSRSVSINETGVSLSGAGTGYKTVTVTVTYPAGGGGGGGVRSFSVSTVVTEYTP